MDCHDPKWFQGLLGILQFPLFFLSNLGLSLITPVSLVHSDRVSTVAFEVKQGVGGRWWLSYKLLI